MNRAQPSATDLFTRDSASDEEIDQVRRDVVAHPQYGDHQWVADAYAACGLDVARGRWRTDTVHQVRECLADKEPFSIVRIGDGEVHFLAFGEYDGTPHLDRHVFQETINIQSDRFSLTESWMLALRDSMYAAVAAADIIGVRGIDRPGSGNGGVERRLAAIDRNLRGGVGVFRSIDTMLRLARRNCLAGKLIASAHLYFGFLECLAEAVERSTRVVCITDKVDVVAALAVKFPQCRFDCIEVGVGKEGDLDFLVRVESNLASDLRGCLCLVGAGVWAELYCMWIKRRGGVAVDIGSGFDLLAGTGSRLIHHALLGKSVKRFAV